MTKKQFTILIFFFCLLLIAYRSTQIEKDPLYPPSAYEGVEFTDEGWYTKAAQVYVKDETFHHPADINFYSHTPLFSMILVPIYQIFGIGILQSRVVSLISSMISIFVFYRICRESFSAIFAILACLIVLIQFDQFNYSRLAILEPLGTLFAIVSLGTWICLNHRIAASSIALLVSILSIFIKTSFVFTYGTVLFLCLYESFMKYRRKEYRESAVIFLCICFSVMIWIGIQTAISLWAGYDWDYFQEINFTKRIQVINGNILNVLHNEMHAIKLLLLRPSFTWVLIFGLFCIAHFIVSAIRRKFALNRSDLAMATWALAGIIFFGMFPFPLLNYYYFLPYPFTYLSFSFISHLSKTKAPVALAAFCFAQISFQFPLYWRYSSQNSPSYINIAEQITAEIHRQTTEHPIVMGPIASFLSLIDPSITPVESYYPKYISHEERVRYWDPTFFVLFQGEKEELPPSISKKLKLLDQYQVLNPTVENIELYEVVDNNIPKHMALRNAG